jgi:hypothetical protein
VAKLLQHQDDGSYYTNRYVDGIVTRRIHPDGVTLLKRHGVRIGGDIPPFAMVQLLARDWLYTEEDAVGQGGINWSPDWNAIGAPPARSRDWIRGSTGWSRLDPVNGGITTVEARQDGIRWSTIGIVAILLLIVGAFLL